MKYDIWKIFLILIAATLCGFVLGYPLQTMLAATLLIIAWQVFRFDQIYRWVLSPKKNPLAHTSGQIEDLHRELNKRIKKNRKRKSQVKNYVKQFRLAISAMPDAIVLIDQQDRIQWANRNASSMLGIMWPNDANLKFSDLIRDSSIAKLLSDKRNDNNDAIEINSPNNSEQIVSIRTVKYSPETRMILARDVSRLVKVNRMHRDFVANVSHELKSPLTVLRGYLEILHNRTDMDKSTAQALAQMDKQGERMQLIVNDLLYLSKLEDELNISKHEIVEVSHLVNMILDTLGSKIEHKSIELALDIDPKLKIIGSETELHSAFQNLVSNAFNYTDNQGQVSITWQAEHGNTGSFSVSDNGKGIARKNIPHLTTRFYRVDGDRSRDSGGTGLGLAIVKHVLQRHNAQLQIESEEGRGSTFSCVFPSVQLNK